MAWALEFDGVNDYLSLDFALLNDDIVEMTFISTGAVQNGDYVFDGSLSNNRCYLYCRDDTGRLDWSTANYKNIKLDGVSISKASANLPSDTDEHTLTCTMNGNSTLGRIGARFTNSGTLNMKFALLTVTRGGSEVLRLDPTASNRGSGAQPVVSDTVGANDAQGNNFPTDGSAWVDLGGGAITYTLTLNPLTATASFGDLQLGYNKSLTLNSLSGTGLINDLTLNYNRKLTLNPLVGIGSFTDLTLEYSQSYKLTLNPLSGAGSFSDLQFNHNKRLTLNPLTGSGNWSTLNLNYTSSATTYALTLSSLVGSGSLNQIQLNHHKELTLNNVSGNGQFDDVALNYNRKLGLNSLSGSGDFNQLQLLHNKSLSINSLTGSGGFSAIQLNWSGLVEQKIDTYTVSYAPNPISVNYSNDLITVKFKE